MTNMEKYPDTAAAHRAYEEYRRKTAEGGVVHVGMQVWLEQEYAARDGLIEAIEYALNDSSIGDGALRRLRAAYEVEKSRPKRNFELYSSREAALNAFRRMCGKTKTCAECRYWENAATPSSAECMAKWMYDTAG